MKQMVKNSLLWPTTKSIPPIYFTTRPLTISKRAERTSPRKNRAAPPYFEPYFFSWLHYWWTNVIGDVALDKPGLRRQMGQVTFFKYEVVLYRGKNRISADFRGIDSGPRLVGKLVKMLVAAGRPL